MNCKGPYRVYTGDDPEHCWKVGNYCGERDTLKEAKELARRALTQEYVRDLYAGDDPGDRKPDKYSQVVNAKDECIVDFFRR
jgi:hypothetical protein